MTDRERYIEIARLLSYAADYLESAAGCAKTIEDQDDVVLSLPDLLAPTIRDVRDWSESIRSLNGRDAS